MSEPQETPAPEEPERSPDWCWTHQEIEPEDER